MDLPAPAGLKRRSAAGSPSGCLGSLARLRYCALLALSNMGDRAAGVDLNAPPVPARCSLKALQPLDMLAKLMAWSCGH